jgi:hypothetical protein
VEDDLDKIWCTHRITIDIILRAPRPNEQMSTTMGRDEIPLYEDILKVGIESHS